MRPDPDRTTIAGGITVRVSDTENSRNGREATCMNVAERDENDRIRPILRDSAWEGGMREEPRHDP
jgi:hypothetical protein